jgi:hypothetical protein
LSGVFVRFVAASQVEVQQQVGEFGQSGATGGSKQVEVQVEAVQQQVETLQQVLDVQTRVIQR